MKVNAAKGGESESTDKVDFGEAKYRDKYKPEDMDFAKRVITRDLDAAVKMMRSDYKGEDGLDLLAEDFANAINPIANKYKIEIGANFFYNEKSKTYVMGNVFTDLNSGSIQYSTYRKDLRINNDLGEHAASIHTHGTYGVASDNRRFSNGDLKFIKPDQFGVPLYMSSSNLQVISPQNSSPRVVKHRINQ